VKDPYYSPLRADKIAGILSFASLDQKLASALSLRTAALVPIRPIARENSPSLSSVTRFAHPGIRLRQAFHSGRDPRLVGICRGLANCQWCSGQPSGQRLVIQEASPMTDMGAILPNLVDAALADEYVS
jgi:hypothetical protein